MTPENANKLTELIDDLALARYRLEQASGTRKIPEQEMNEVVEAKDALRKFLENK